jgi:hypothetical protein
VERNRGAWSEIGPGLAYVLYLFWYMRGYFSEGREWYERFLAKFPGNQWSLSLRANLSWTSAFLAWRQGDYAAAGTFGDQSAALGRSLDGNRNTVMALAFEEWGTSCQCRRQRFAPRSPPPSRRHLWGLMADERGAHAWI